MRPGTAAPHTNRRPKREEGGWCPSEAAAARLLALPLESTAREGFPHPPPHFPWQGAGGLEPSYLLALGQERAIGLPHPHPHLLWSPAQGAFADGRGGFVLEEGGAAAPLPAVLLRVVLMGLERGVLVSGSPAAAAAAGARLSLPALERRRRRELLGVLKRPRLGLRRGLGGGSRVLLAEAAVLGAELVQAPLQLVDALALGVDEALLVLHDGGELLQVEHGAHRVLQQALHAPGPGPSARRARTHPLPARPAGASLCPLASGAG